MCENSWNVMEQESSNHCTLLGISAFFPTYCSNAWSILRLPGAQVPGWGIIKCTKKCHPWIDFKATVLNVFKLCLPGNMLKK